MPSLKQLTCSVEWLPTGVPFQEHGTVYGDGVVETFIAVPERPQLFGVHMKSKGFISEGLAVIVFIDGEYQCNRNRTNLRPFRKGADSSLTEIEFRLRQKEKPVSDGTYLGREWRFDAHNIVPELPPDVDRGHFDQLGSVEVLILRCLPKSGSDGAQSKTSSGADSHPLERIAEGDMHVNAGEEIAGEEDNDKGPAVCNSSEGHTLEPTVEILADEDDGNGIFGNFFSQSDGPPERPDDFNPGLPRGNSSGRWNHIWSSGRPQNGQPAWQTAQNAAPTSSGHSSLANGMNPQDPRTSGFAGSDPKYRPEKRVHWDYGLRGVPASDPRGLLYGEQPRFERSWQSHNYARQQQARASDWGRLGPSSHPQSPYPGDPAGPYGTSRQAFHEYNDCYPYPAPPPSPSLRPPYPPAEHTGHHGWTPAPGPPRWTSPQPAYPLGPEVPVFIPPYHHNHPYYSQAGGYAGGQPGPASGAGWPNPNQSMQSNAGAGGFDPAKDSNQNENIANNGQTNKSGTPGDNWDINNPMGSNQPISENCQSGNNSGNNGGKTSSDDNCGSGGDQPNDSDANQNDNSLSNENNFKQSGANDNWDNTNNTQPAPGNDRSTVTGQANADPAYKFSQSSGNQPRSLFGPHGPYLSLKSSASADLEAGAEEEPRYDVPQSIVDETGTTRQVLAGRGYLYIHKGYAPEYIDSIDEPYARFVFKYRTKEQLKREIGVELDTEPSGDEKVQELQAMDKQQIIEMLLRAQSALGGKIPSPPPHIGSPGGEAPGVLQPVAVAPPIRTFLNYTLPTPRNASGEGGGPQGQGSGKPAGGFWGNKKGSDDQGWGSLGNTNGDNSNNNNNDYQACGGSGNISGNSNGDTDNNNGAPGRESGNANNAGQQSQPAEIDDWGVPAQNQRNNGGSDWGGGGAGTAPSSPGSPQIPWSKNTGDQAQPMSGNW